MTLVAVVVNLIILCLRILPMVVAWVMVICWDGRDWLILIGFVIRRLLCMRRLRLRVLTRRVVPFRLVCRRVLLKMG